MFGVDEVLLEILQGVIIELEPPLEHTIREAFLVLQELQDLRKDGIVVHYCPSTGASAAFACGNCHVMSMARYSAIAADSLAQAWRE